MRIYKIAEDKVPEAEPTTPPATPPAPVHTPTPTPKTSSSSNLPPTGRNAKKNLFLSPTRQATPPCPAFGPCPTLSYFYPKSQTPGEHWTK